MSDNQNTTNILGRHLSARLAYRVDKDASSQMLDALITKAFENDAAEVASFAQSEIEKNYTLIGQVN